MMGENTAMVDREDLVQRFIDQELSAEERVRFVVRLGTDEALRHRLIELEQLMLGVNRLPPPVVPDGFVARVMERTASARPFRRRWAEALWVPHTLRWNLAGAMAAASLCLVVGGGLYAGSRARQPSAPRVSEEVRSTGSPASTTVLVRLVVVQPGARTVEAAGDFNGWNPTQTPLEQISNGAWTVTIPLQPGRYEYMYVVDGQQWIADPFAAEQNDDGFGSQNAVLEVRPAATSPL